jgi:hypothetical protein
MLQPAAPSSGYLESEYNLNYTSVKEVYGMYHRARQTDRPFSARLLTAVVEMLLHYFVNSPMFDCLVYQQLKMLEMIQ